MAEYIIKPPKKPNQILSMNLGGQQCIVLLRQLNGRQYMSLEADNKIIFKSVLIQDRIPLKKYGYLPFKGDIASFDLRGTSYPTFSEWGDRFQLIYSDTGFNDD